MLDSNRIIDDLLETIYHEYVLISNFIFVLEMFEIDCLASSWKSPRLNVCILTAPGGPS